jgi:hypothetical protein
VVTGSSVCDPCWLGDDVVPEDELAEGELVEGELVEGELVDGVVTAELALSAGSCPEASCMPMPANRAMNSATDAAITRRRRLWTR